MRQNLHVNQADMGEGLRRVRVKEQLIDKRAAQTSVPDGEAFEVNQPFQDGRALASGSTHRRCATRGG